MSVTLDWTVEIGGVDTSTDFTDRCQGFNISQRLQLSRITSHRAIITLDNQDGALTPGAGGTYDSVDWFAQAVFISCSVNGTDTAETFHGIVDDFDFFDDGTRSTVTITAVDWLTIGSRALSQSDVTIVSSNSWPSTVNNIFIIFIMGNTGPTPDYYVLPKLDRTYGEVRAGAIGSDIGGFPFLSLGTVDIRFDWKTGDSLGDILTNNVQPGVPSVIWPTFIESDTYRGTDVAFYRWCVVGDLLSRTDSNANTYTFVAQSPSAGELLIGDIDRGYNIDELVNQTELETIWSSHTASATDTTSTTTYGIRSYRANSSYMEADADLDKMASTIVNRFAEPRFTPRRLTFTNAHLASLPAGSSTQVAKLLDANQGLWQACTTEYTPTGTTTTVTDSSVISGRTIRVTPGSTSVVIDLLPSADYQTFVLDSAVLGVLDENRLG